MLTANSQGIVTGKLTVPANIPAGNKRVSFMGVAGSCAEATFAGQGTLVRQTLQQTVDVNTTTWQSPPAPQPIPVPPTPTPDPVMLTCNLVASIREGETKPFSFTVSSGLASRVSRIKLEALGNSGAYINISKMDNIAVGEALTAAVNGTGNDRAYYFAYTAYDANGAVVYGPSRVSINILSGNRPPNSPTCAIACSATPGINSTFWVTATDPDGQALTYSLSANDPRITFSKVSVDGASEQWRAYFGSTLPPGSVTINVTATDLQGASRTASVRVAIVAAFPASGPDPLAQTFLVTEAAQVTGVDLWFTAKGSSDVDVQIRKTAVGFPTQEIIAAGRITSAVIATTGSTRINFPRPVALTPNEEYALVVLCNDPDTAVAVAELGKWDVSASRWVTSQPYQVGVLLSSSNASTWSAHQDRDLAFRLVRASYSQTSAVVNLGNVTVTGATDLMLMAYAERPSNAARVDYTLTLPDASTVSVADGQPVRLPSSITGNVGVSATLVGTDRVSPTLFPGTQLVSGDVSASGNYVTPAIPAGNASRVRVIFDAALPAGSAVAVAVKGVDAGDTWTAVPNLSATPLGDEWYEVVHEITNLNEASIHCQLELSGTTLARPRVKNLRVIVL